MRALTLDELKFVSGGSDVVEKVNVTAKRKPSDPSNPFPSTGTQTETVTVPSKKTNTLDLDFDATKKPDSAAQKPYGDEDGDGDIDEIDHTIWKFKNSPGGLNADQLNSLKIDNALHDFLRGLGLPVL